MTDVERWVTDSPYCCSIGIAPVAVDGHGATLLLPFRDANANPGGALHGGIAASLSLCAGQAVARAALGPGAGPWHTAAIQINYLAAGIGEALQAEAALLRRGKELCFAGVDIRGADNKAVASSLVTVRGRSAAAAAPPSRRFIEVPCLGPSPMGERMTTNPFIAGRGIRMTYQADGLSFLSMPWKLDNGDLDGTTHEGAVLALLDTAGAMAAWSLVEAGRFKASTASIQAQILAPVPPTDLEAHASVRFRDRELFWADVEVAEPRGLVYARGTVIYRIVT